MYFVQPHLFLISLLPAYDKNCLNVSEVTDSFCLLGLNENFLFINYFLEKHPKYPYLDISGMLYAVSATDFPTPTAAVNRSRLFPLVLASSVNASRSSCFNKRKKRYENMSSIFILDV